MMFPVLFFYAGILPSGLLHRLSLYGESLVIALDKDLTILKRFGSLTPALP